MTIRPRVWAVLLAVSIVFWLLLGLAVRAVAAEVDYVVDGDTVRLESGAYVRVIGIDTPERGQCGYDAAKARLTRFVGEGTVRLVLPAGHEDRDHYGRLLRYVQKPHHRDAGKVLLKRGLANARYDGFDGYDWHPRQYRYREIDERVPHVCPALD